MGHEWGHLNNVFHNMTCGFAGDDGCMGPGPRDPSDIMHDTDASNSSTKFETIDFTIQDVVRMVDFRKKIR